MLTGESVAHRFGLLLPEWVLVRGLGTVIALRMLGLFMLLPVVAVYASELRGSTSMRIGLAVGIYGLTQAFLQWPLARWSDARSRKLVAGVGLGCFISGSLLAAYADHILLFILGRVFQGGGAIAAVLLAWVADGTREALRTRVMALLGMVVGMSFIVAIAVGPLLAALLSVRGLFCLSAVMALTAMLVVIRLPESDASHQRRGEREGVIQFLSRRTLPEMWPYLTPLIGVFCLHALLAALFVWLPIKLHANFHLSAHQTGEFYLAAIALSLLGTVMLIISAERWLVTSTAQMIAGALVLIGVGSVFWGSQHDGGIVILVAALSVFFAGFNFLEANWPAEVSRIAGSEARGSALGLYTTLQFLGVFIGGLVAGVASPL